MKRCELADLRPGTDCVWTLRHPWNGEPRGTRVVRTAAEPFAIPRNGQLPVEVVELTCKRLAKVEDLRIWKCEDVADADQLESVRTAEPTGLDAGGGRQCSSPTTRRDDVDAEPVRTGDSALPAGSGSSPDLLRAAAFQRPVATERPQAEPSQPCKVLAIDFLNLLVRAYHAGKPTETHAVRSLFQTMASAVRALRPERIVFALDGGHAHRDALLPAYKAHRPAPEPLLVKQRELAERALKAAGLQAVRVVDFEADDIIASIADFHQNVVICSSDKDLLALGGYARIYHPWGAGAFVTAEEMLGLPSGQVTDFLALCGDTSDGVPGVKGIGEKTALALLQQFGSLEAILCAARTLRIPGAVGKKLREQSADALLCHRVIELRSDLPIPALEPWRPPAGWETALQSMGLGSVAAIIEALLAFVADTRSQNPCVGGLSAATGKAELSESCANGNPESPPAAVEGRSFDQVPTSPIPAAVNPSTGQPVREDTASGIASTRIQRSKLSEFVTLNRSVDENFSGPDRGVIACWEAGRQVLDPCVECPWKPDTANAVAWHQGRRGDDLDVVLPSSPAAPAGQSAITREPAAAPKPAARRITQPSLF